MPKSRAFPQGDRTRTTVQLPAGDQHLLAEALKAFQADQPERAAGLVSAFLALHPDHPGGLHLGGVISLQQGRLDTGIARLRQAARLSPGEARIRADLGLALEMSGQRMEAETAYRAALAVSPALPQVLLNLGRLLETQARDDEAAETYAALIRLQPNSGLALTRLAAVELRLMQPTAAIDTARRAIAADPTLVEPQQTLAGALDTLGRVDEAIAARQQVIAQHPDAAFGYADLGMTQMHHGRLAEAEANYRHALALDPGHGAWWRQLSYIVPHRERDADIAAMEALHHSNGVGPEDKLEVCFGIGKALDDIGAFDEAFNYFLEGNGLKRSGLSYSSDETDRLFDRMKAVFTPERFARHAGGGSPDETPIFVLGMPRSSTSLVEQVLASHPDVSGGGEFRLVNQLVGGLAQGPGFPLGEALDHIGAGALRRMGERYVAQVRALAPGARFITDKLPGNFIMIGMIRLMLPNARIIHCRRNPVDNCLSLFKNVFAAQHLRYAYDLREIGHYYARYLDLMAHWHKVLPGVIHDVTYEELVADFDGKSKALMAYCGLDWRPECREFFNTRRSVQTASSAQVRRPIYSTSIGQGARYGERIAPLLEALAE